MKLDVVVPTYNRSQLLQRTLASLLQAPLPSGLDVTVLVVDNNSKDDTESVVRQMQARSSRKLVYVKETKQGSSQARNAGILAGSSELIGFIDDDEEIHPDWYQVVAREFADEATQFIGGPYLPNWGAAPPDWLPPGYHAVIGVVLPRPRAVFGDGYQGNLMGGNAVLRRSAFDRVGLYDTQLGRDGNNLLAEEDAEFYRRLQKAGLRGIYAPDLIIHHFIPAERLTRSYHRRWCYWRGVSMGLADRSLREPVRYLLGIPLYRIGRAARGLLAYPKHKWLLKDSGNAFADELATWDLFGFFYGKHWFRIDRHYKTEKGPA